MKTVIEMAKEAGLEHLANLNSEFVIAELERFAATVREDEREACAKVCDDIERKKWEIVTQGGQLNGIMPRDCAAAIRARGLTKSNTGE